VIHAGFPGGAGADYYRPGTWCPLVVSLQNAGTEHAPGRLILRQRDKDGDVMVAEALVTLTADGQARPYRLDFVANRPERAGAFEVSLLHAETGQPIPVHDEQGQPHASLPAPRAAALSEKTTLVLDISARPISKLDVLADNSAELLKQEMVVARFRLADLPDRWYSLQAVQAIIWNAPDASRLEPQQMRALMDYVRAGGILVLAAGRTAGGLAASPLGQILPATVNGTASADVLGRVWKDLLRTRSWGDRPPPQYVPSITVARARAKPTATVVCPEDGLGIHAVTRQRWGSGVVVFVAAELRDLFQVHAESPRFFKEVLGLLGKPPKVDTSQSWPQQQDLYDYMHGIIGFEAVTGLLLVFVVLFVAGYILLATLATWGWLRRRNALQHCWLAFAVVASVSSVLSIGAAQGLLGVGTDLRQMCVVDVSVPSDSAGPLQAQAVAYFGLRTSTHTRLDVRLASDRAEGGFEMHRSYLHPLPTSRARTARGYVAPESYHLRADQAMMEAVPIRATLKRLQGYWFGQLEGSFSAMIEVDTSFPIDVRGWVRNDLGVDLHDCWLIVARTDRMGGETTDRQLFVHQIARTLKSGGGRYSIETQTDPSVTQTDWVGLQDWQKRWAGRFMLGGGRRRRGQQEPKFEMDKFPTTLMLLTTMDEYDETAAAQNLRLELNRSHGLHLDRCHLLTKDTAMMVGFADTPGPVRLEVRPGGQATARWRPIEPEFGHTMFRILIPVRSMVARQETPL